MPDYIVRRATLDDVDTLVSHRIKMFEDMGVLSTAGADPERLGAAFKSWLFELMPAGTYVAWVVDAKGENGPAGIVSGGGATLIPWPPGPRYSGSRLAFVYNVYTEPAHRRRGLGRLVMQAIHDWCRAQAITAIALNTSPDGQPLYESMGYRVTTSPMMLCEIDKAQV